MRSSNWNFSPKGIERATTQYPPARAGRPAGGDVTHAPDAHALTSPATASYFWEASGRPCDRAATRRAAASWPQPR
eukprot:7272573-Prymnesium_polylepis.1